MRPTDLALKKDHLAFLFGGLAFGFLLGFGLFRAIDARPGRPVDAADAGEVPGPMGPAAPTQTAPGGGGGGGRGGGAPMMAEINALKERIQKDPKDAAAWTRLGNMYQDAQMFDQATDFYQRALKLTPQNADVLTDLGFCYQELQQFDKALDALERAQKADPSNWQSLYNIAVVAGLHMGQFDKADAALTRLQQVHPDAPNLAELRVAVQKAR